MVFLTGQDEYKPKWRNSTGKYLIGIIGAGVFSASIANMLAQNTENKIIMWSENKQLVTDYKKKKKL